MIVTVAHEKCSKRQGKKSASETEKERSSFHEL